jgi:hypothetical protein
MNLNMNKIFTLNESKEWNGFLNKLPLEMQDVHFMPEYYKVQENNREGKSICFCYIKNKEIALYPFLFNSVNNLGYDLDDQYYDIQGATGYNGVAFSSRNEQFISDFYKEFNLFCTNNKIVAEFTRYNPILNNQEFSNDNYEVLYDRKVVLIDLQEEIEKIEAKYYSGANRNSIRKAISKGIKTNIVTDINSYITFHNIYMSLMDFLKAEKKYRYSQNYFSDIFYQLSKHNILIMAIFEGRPIGGAMAIFNEINSHYFLSAVLPEFRNSGANNLLLNELIMTLKKYKIKTINLGGGKTSSPKDNLLRYKMSFSKGLTSFFIGKRIINKNVYENIVSQWKEMRNPSGLLVDQMILGYRNIT